jgi:uncharacterized protein YfiM (DUF2279 family)
VSSGRALGFAGFAGFAIVFATVVGPQFAQAEQMDLGRRDHQTHFAASAMGTVVIGSVYESAGAQYPVGLGLVTMLAIGAAKEFLIDRQASQGDLQADLAGSLSGATLLVIKF